MLGAIIGDIVGSPYEFDPIKTTDFPLFTAGCRFTDDSVLTIATASAILADGDYAAAYKNFGRRYPDAGYGGNFRLWLAGENSDPYNSWGNGSAMRVSPVALAFDSIDEVLAEAEKSAAVTHNHPEGIKGAQATALAIFLARTGTSKDAIRDEIETRFTYDLDRTLAEIRPHYHFDVSCQGTVPEAIIAFLESESYEDAIRKAVSLGGDSDTLACITGSIAQAHYKQITPETARTAMSMLPADLLEVLGRFTAQYPL